MNKRLLRWLTIVIPVGFLVILLSTIDIFFEGYFSFWGILSALLIVSLGAGTFSAWVFRFIDEREAEIRRRAIQLEALNSASLALTTELDLSLVLQKVVDISRGLISSKYCALGVLDESGQYFEQFITSGISDEDRIMIGSPPHGKGIFEILLKEGKPVIVNDIGSHEKRYGFPVNHPEMHTLLGVPVRIKGKVIGDLYLSEKIDDAYSENPKALPYTYEDQQILEMFATQAAIAIENARLYRQIQDLAVLEERERFGMDLHDGTIQSIYAVGLMLEDLKRRISVDPENSKEKITQAILSLNNAISDIRNYILDLRPQHFQGRNVVQGIEELARALRANTFMDVDVITENIEPERLNSEQTIEILHIAQEALSNVQKHARASFLEISLEIINSKFELKIRDNGISIPEEKLIHSTGNGLKNMAERASILNGEIEVKPCEGGGTEVFLTIPI